jgi:dipeptidyl aminopeptidase/acylaminoacyl peptidase
MPHRILACALLLGLILSASPASATITLIDPYGTSDTPEPQLTLEPDEIEKITALQQTAFTSLFSEISPDDRAVFAVTFGAERLDLAFRNVIDGSTVPLNELALIYGPISEIRWRDARTAAWLSFDFDVGPVLVEADSFTGDVVTSTLTLPGFPLSLAPNASRLLVAIEPPGDDVPIEDAVLRVNRREVQRGAFELTLPSPFKRIARSRPDELPHAPGFDTHNDMEVAEISLSLASLDLLSGELTPLVDIPEGSGLLSQPAWTPDGSKLALVRVEFPETGRGGNRLSEWITQDALGNLPREFNPLWTGNAIDVFDLASGDLRPAALRARDGDGVTYNRVGWSTDGQTLMAQVQHPALLAGRRFPTYLFPDRSSLRFFDAALNPIGGFERPEINAPNAAFPQWLSPDEIVFNAAYGLSYRLYYYNRVSGEFRQVSIEDGTYYEVRSTRLSRQLVFSFSSFGKPPDLYRIGWAGQALAGLSYENYDLHPLNQIRADRIDFRLRSGAQRSGYLLQPADAPFPPRNTPLVVWQQGGPGGTITNEWAANVEQPFNLLPNFGIAVLVVPGPGREGWGPRLYNELSNGRNYGAVDVDEMAEIVGQMIRRGYVKRGAVGITGCSYGGYFAAQSIVRHPNLYAAANPQCSLLDLFTEWQFGFTPRVSYHEGRSPTLDPAEYTADSPLFNTARIRTPLLIFHGTDDFLPVRIVENWHDQLEARDVPVTFLQFANEGHGLSDPANQLTAAQAQIAWFRDNLTR